MYTLLSTIFKTSGLFFSPRLPYVYIALYSLFVVIVPRSNFWMFLYEMEIIVRIYFVKIPKRKSYNRRLTAALMPGEPVPELSRFRDCIGPQVLRPAAFTLLEKALYFRLDLGNFLRFCHVTVLFCLSIRKKSRMRFESIVICDIHNLYRPTCMRRSHILPTLHV